MQPPGNAGPQKLTEAVLNSLDPRVERPTYDRHQLGRGIVHIGVGHFSRSHSAVYLDELAQKGKGQANGWGICGVGLQSHDRKMLKALIPQQCLYTVVTRSAEEDRARVIGSLTSYLFAPVNPDAVLSTLTDAGTRIVTMTITEGGYNVDAVTGKFNAANSAVQEDLRNPSRPTTVFGYLCEALDRRRQAGLPPFTVFSLDNLPGNGVVARDTLLAFACLRDESLHNWIKTNVAFPSCMVDRITPGTKDADRKRVEREFGIIDAWPVMCEPFRQWVVEDKFCNGRKGRPPLEEVEVQFTTDVHPYDMMKLRLLNASHSAMGYLGYLAGHRYIHKVIDDPLFRDYIARLMDDEVTPLLTPPPGFDLVMYKQTLLERFANPKIRDRVARICSNGSDKMPKFLLQSITDALANNGPRRLLTLAVAGWFRYLRGTDMKGNAFTIEDSQAERLRELARKGGDNPRLLLSHQIFVDLGKNEEWVKSLETALRNIDAHGVKDTLSQYLKDSSV